MNPSVKRITVDEQLADDLIRFEVCSLKEQGEFFYSVESWGEKKHELIHKSDYKRKLHLTQPWNTLKESQVFLVGEFEVVGDPANPDSFKTSLGKRKSIRIDDKRKFKDNVKETYFKLLKRR